MSSLFLRVAALAAAMLPVLATAVPLTLEQALERAQQRSEALRSARAGATSATESARAAGQLPDPMLGVSIENLPVTGPDRFSTTRESMTMKRIALAQEWVSPEKRRLRTAAAQAAAAREGAAVGAAAADARLQTALAFIDAYYAAEVLKLSSANEDHAREAGLTARARLSSGNTSAQDALGLLSAQGLAADEAAEARQQVASASVVLNRWTGVAADELAPPRLPGSRAEQAFVDAHPLVVARRREVAAATGEAAAIAANRSPNWTWEVAYGQRSGYSDLLTVGVTIPLAIAPQARQDRETAAKLALAEKAEAELAEATRAAQAEYRTLAGDAQRVQERIRSYEAGVLAPAAQRTAAAHAALAANQASVPMVFDARHAELEARRKLVLLQRELARIRAQLAFRPLNPEELQ
jgi:outer membrane protein, heavy metal efflux system